MKKTCQICGGEGFIRQPLKTVQKIIRNLQGFQEVLSTRHGGIDACPACQAASESEYDRVDLTSYRREEIIMRPRKEEPYSVRRGRVEVDTYLLTHAEWHPCDFGMDYAQYETGVRYKQPDGEYRGWTLFQHGWHDFEAVTKVIVKGLNKGWDEDRIQVVIDYLRSRRMRAKFV